MKDNWQSETRSAIKAYDNYVDTDDDRLGIKYNYDI